MSEKPILFSTPMVQAILREENHKTMTRRVIKPQTVTHSTKKGLKTESLTDFAKRNKRDLNLLAVACAPYQPGDILWVRETFCYHANAEKPWYGYKADGDYRDTDYRWKPSIHMPRAAARLFLRVTDVRAERIQDISEADAKAEGIRSYFIHKEHGGEWHEARGQYVGVERTHRTRRDAFAELWNSLNAKRGYGWDVNPWVWVYTFERIRKEDI